MKRLNKNGFEMEEYTIWIFLKLEEPKASQIGDMMGNEILILYIPQYKLNVLIIRNILDIVIRIHSVPMWDWHGTQCPKGVKICRIELLLDGDGDWDVLNL